MQYLCTYFEDFNETWHKYYSCDWTMLKRFLRSEVKGLNEVENILHVISL